jgi:pimeloyl-ACP methyl ester carboxylesterase
VASHDTSARLGAIAAPTFVVHGSEDVMIVPANAGLIADRIPDSRVELLDGVGHMFWWEQPERAAELVREHVWTATTSS